MQKLKAPGPDQPHGQRRRSFNHPWAEWKLNAAPLRTTFHGYDSRRVIARLSVHPGPPRRLECVAGQLGVKAVPQLRWPFVPPFPDTQGPRSKSSLNTCRGRQFQSSARSESVAELPSGDGEGGQGPLLGKDP
ncbi:hypothetical protein PAL_GLEAN10002657 [Pteropus alecto]|uniref:Uncharacterized protein n=1 Tax=Pteropus alecto TaxID=9402 RepID=L5KCE2_PTEAL|nr:hypothetical protein PAL_GLEAN10002657 [Pteropus alecto]